LQVGYDIPGGPADARFERNRGHLAFGAGKAEISDSECAMNAGTPSRPESSCKDGTVGSGEGFGVRVVGLVVVGFAWVVADGLE